jgi:glycosyltransferase involved in cell wall biosynthesis
MENDNRLPLYGIFSDVFPPMMDGVSLTVKNYADWLHRKGQNVCVVTPACAPSAGNVGGEDYPVVRYFSLPVPMRKPYRWGLSGIDCNFFTQINGLPFALLHAHSPFSAGRAALRLAKKRKIPIVATFHSKYKSDFERVIPSKKIIGMLVKSIVDFYEQVDEVWIPQASVEAPLREYGYRGKVVVVGNGNDFADGERIEPLRDKAREQLRLRNGEWMFLFVGQHIWEKNVALIIRALARLEGVPFKMFFVGTGYAGAKMREMVTDAGLDEKVVFAGAITDRSTLKEYYAAADLFLFPSLYDNAPLVVREAAALQTPSVLLEGATAAEIIIHGSNGFLTENTAEAFAGCIAEIIARPGALQAAGLHASQTIARPWENIIGEALDRYRKLLHAS